MASIATQVLWGSSSPKIYFDFSYEKKRTGSTQCYAITVSARPLLTSTSYFGYPIYVQISLDGVSKTTFTLKKASPKNWTSAITSTTGWLEVAGKTSGTTALKIRIYSGSGSSREGTYNYPLATDPAASSISSTSSYIGSKPIITIAKADPNFTHTVTWAFGSISGTVADKTSATTINDWVIPESFYGQIPNVKTGSCVLTCTTYSGSTAIGSSTCTFTVSANASICSPTFKKCTVVDANEKTKALTGDENILIRYYSTALCTADAQANNGASLSSVYVSGASTLPARIENVETDAFTFWAEDSRGYASSALVIRTLIPYEKLTANVTMQRTDPTSGNATLSISGNYYNGSLGAVRNSLLVKYRVGNGEYIEIEPDITGNEYTAYETISGLEYTKAHSVEVVVEDKLATITKPNTVPKGIPVFDWGEDSFNFNVPVYISGVELVEYVIAKLREQQLL